ncbi:unnamed protein product [Kluyveromyces dobzhanskii CBS 2104]|uniref:WGS project CCBQ000000000 data, contig 00272 n=1 Tax=Kluyveromyces dobzhanskii CBS 2104 TaxID=1427455 RepID=A0A0A8L8A4_9SACH|nr:unnamed protein product [Kluyveromyces dobzhanskii CBS 2104]
MSGARPRQHIKKPDVGVRDKKLEPLNVQLKKIDQELALIKQQIDNTDFSKDAKSSKEKLQGELKEVIKTQSDLKSKRQQVHDKIKFLDAQIKRKSGEISDLVGKNKKFQNVSQVKQRLAEIDEEIASGELSLVEERLRVKEMQNLSKLSKDYQVVEPIRKSIEEEKQQIDALKQELTASNPREVANKFETIQGEINNLNSKNQVVYDKRKVLITKRSALYSKRDEIYAQIRKIRGDFDNEFKSFKRKMDDERLKREEDEKLSKILEDKEEKVGKLQEKLNHAKQPAFTFELESIENILTVLDPTYVKPVKNVLGIDFGNTSQQPATPAKVVDSEGLVPIVKEREGFFAAPTVSKSKKHKKKTQSTKFSLEPSMIALLAELDIRVPLSKEDVPATVEQLKAKHEELTGKQSDATDKNIAEAEEQLKKLQLDYEAKEQKVKEEIEAKKLKEQKEKEEEVAAATEA